MAGFSDYMEGEIIKWTLRPGVTPDFAQPANVYVALFTTLPAEAGTGGVEVSTSGTGYARQIGTFDSVGANSVQLNFATATADWGTVVGASLCQLLWKMVGGVLQSGVCYAATFCASLPSTKWPPRSTT